MRSPTKGRDVGEPLTSRSVRAAEGGTDRHSAGVGWIPSQEPTPATAQRSTVRQGLPSNPRGDTVAPRGRLSRGARPDMLPSSDAPADPWSGWNNASDGQGGKRESGNAAVVRGPTATCPDPAAHGKCLASGAVRSIASRGDEWGGSQEGTRPAPSPKRGSPRRRRRSHGRNPTNPGHGSEEHRSAWMTQRPARRSLYDEAQQ